MKKGMKFALAVLASGRFLASCQNTPSDTPKPSLDSQERVNYYLVSFYVDNTLYKTLRVKEGDKADASLVDAPAKEGYEFLNWTTKDGKAFDFENTKIVSAVDLYASFEKKTTPIAPDDDPITDLNVDDTKDDTKNYYLVVGWYAKTATSGLDDELVKHFYSNVNVYLTAKGATKENLSLVSFRKFSQDKAADRGAARNEQGDLDLVIGVGNNINSTAGVSVKEKTGNIPRGGQSRYIARLSDNERATSLYEFLKTETGQKRFDAAYTLSPNDVPSTPEPDPEPGEDPSTELNVDDTKDPAKNYYLVVGWYAKTATSGLDDELVKHFYSNVNIYLTAKGATKENLSLVSFRKFSQDKVADRGAARNEQGDLDLVIGVGGNLTSKGLVETKELDGNIPRGGQSRYIARLSDNERATSLYAFLKTETGQKRFDASYTLTAEDIA